MFKLHPILSNKYYELLKPAYDVSSDIQKAPDLELDSHRLAQKWEEALSSQTCIAYGYTTDANDKARVITPLYLLLTCQQIAHNRFNAVAKTLSLTLEDQMLSDTIGIEFTYYGDIMDIELSIKYRKPILMHDVEEAFDVLEQ